MAYLTAIIVKKKDMPDIEINKQTDVFSVKEEYCVGCGLCAEILPEYYEMKNNKACVKASPDNKEAVKAVMESAQKCPTKAIIFEKAMKG
jgi:ferredoxin